MAHADQEALAAAPEMRQLSVAPEWPGATHSSTNSPGRAAAWSVLSLRHPHFGHTFSPLNTSDTPYTHHIFLFSSLKAAAGQEQAEHKVPKKGSFKV